MAKSLRADPTSNKPSVIAEQLPSDVYRRIVGDLVPQQVREAAASTIQRAYHRWRQAWRVPVCVDVDGQQIHVGSVVEIFELSRGGQCNVFGPSRTMAVEHIRCEWGWGRVSMFYYLRGRDWDDCVAAIHVRVLRPVKCQTCNDHFFPSDLASEDVCQNCAYHRGDPRSEWWNRPQGRKIQAWLS